MLFDILEKHLTDIVYLNCEELVQQICDEARSMASDEEKEEFFQRYIRTLNLKCNADGSFEVVLRK